MQSTHHFFERAANKPLVALHRCTWCARGARELFSVSNSAQEVENLAKLFVRCRKQLRILWALCESAVSAARWPCMLE